MRLDCINIGIGLAVSICLIKQTRQNWRRRMRCISYVSMSDKTGAAEPALTEEEGYDIKLVKSTGQGDRTIADKAAGSA